MAKRRAVAPGDADGAVELEIAHHIEALTERLVAEGWSREAAAGEAVRRFGDVDRHRRAMLRETEARGQRLRMRDALQSIGGDVRHALRGLRRQPTFAAAVIATLGIGIAAAATVFTVVDPLLLRPLPWHEPDRVMQVAQVRADGSASSYIPAERARVWSETADVLGPIAMYTQTSAVYTGGEEPESAYGLVVSHDLNDVIGVRAAIGRTFLPEDAAPGVRRVMIGQGFWRRLGEDPSIVGSTIELDGTAYEVVGVLPRDFKFPVAGTPPDIWMVSADAIGGGGMPPAQAVARLMDDVSLEVAQARLDVLAEGLDRERPLENGTWRIRIRPEGEWRGNRDFVRGLWLLAAAVGLMLLIALTNAVNLLVLRGADRARELEVRRALGGSRGRILRQVVCEGLVLGVASGLVALVAVLAATTRLDTILPSDFTFSSAFSFRVEQRVLFFTFGTAVAAGFVLGLIPGYRAVRGGTSFGLLKGRGGTDRDRRMTLGLAGFEIALAMMLLAGAGLIGGSFVRMTRVDPGFDAGRVAAMAVQVPEQRYPTPESRQAFFDRLEAGLERIDGVAAATVANGVPPHTGFSFGIQLQPEGGEPLETRPELLLPHISVPADYVDVIGARILAGRGFGPGDAGTDNVLIDDRLASALWPGGQAVGRQFRYEENGTWYTVIGVYAHLTMMGLDDRVAPYGMLFPAPRVSGGSYRSVIVRAHGDPAAVLQPMRRAVREVDPQLPVFRLMTSRDALAESIEMPRLLAAVMVSLSLLALFLAAVGIYGVLAYAATRRRREMGIRMALGATARGVRRLIVRQGLFVAAAGVAVGLAGAALLGRAAGSLVFGMEPNDPATLGLAAAVLIAAAALASWLPSRRATRVDPAEVLRAD